MYDLQPAAASLHQGALLAFSAMSGLLIGHSQRTLEICSNARQELLHSLAHSPTRQPSELGKMASQTTDTLHRHSLSLAQESLEALLALQEEVVRFYESHNHSLNQYLTHTLEKAGQASPAEMLPAMNLFRHSLANFDHALVHLSDSAVQAAGQIEAGINAGMSAEPVAATPEASTAAEAAPKRPVPRRKSA